MNHQQIQQLPELSSFDLQESLEDFFAHTTLPDLQTALQHKHCSTQCMASCMLSLFSPWATCSTRIENMSQKG